MASFFTPTLKNTRVSSTMVDSSGVYLAISVYFSPRVWRLSESHRKPRNTSQMDFHCWSFALLLVPRANLVVFVEYCMVRGLPGVHKQDKGTHRLNQRKDLRPDEPNVECCAASPLRPLYLLAWPRQRRRALRRGLVSTCHFTKSIRTEEPWGWMRRSSSSMGPSEARATAAQETSYHPLLSSGGSFCRWWMLWVSKSIRKGAKVKSPFARMLA